MSKFQPPKLHDDICRAATDKQTHKQTYIHTYIHIYILSENRGNLFSLVSVFFCVFFSTFLSVIV